MTEKMTEKEIFEFWKNNEKAYMFAPKEAQEWLRENSKESLVLSIRGDWTPDRSAFIASSVYRLPADYRPPKVGRWVECEVTEDEGIFWKFGFGGHSWSLDKAPGMAGFGGVFYLGLGWVMGLAYYPEKSALGGGLSGEKPIVPTKVRFWVEY